MPTTCHTTAHLQAVNVGLSLPRFHIVLDERVIHVITNSLQKKQQKG